MVMTDEQAEQVQHHGELERVVLVQRLPPGQHDGHHRVAVVEGLVPDRARGQEHRVAGLVIVAILLPQPTRRIQPGLVRDLELCGGYGFRLIRVRCCVPGAARRSCSSRRLCSTAQRPPARERR